PLPAPPAPACSAPPGAGASARSAPRAARGCAGPWSYLREAAVDEQLGAGDVARVVGGEEHHRFRDLVRRADPAEGNGARDGLAALLADIGGRQQVAQAGRIDRAGADGVHADAAGLQVRRPRARERAHRGFGGGIDAVRRQALAACAMEAFRMIEAPSGMSGSAFRTVKSRPFTLMSKIES